MDFAEFRLPWGKRHALLVVLGYSRLMWLQYYERQTMAVVMEGLELAFRYFRGVPSELLFDQMKAVIVEDNRNSGGQLVENPEFVRFAAHWGFRIRACRPYRAQTKGKVERPVDRYEAERPHLKPLARWPYRPVVPRPTEPGQRQAEAAVSAPIVEVERRPLAEYARMTGAAQ